MTALASPGTPPALLARLRRLAWVVRGLIVFGAVALVTALAWTWAVPGHALAYVKDVTSVCNPARLGPGTVSDFFQLYSAPGVDHVGTGGPANVDMLPALVGWVERGEVPTGLQIVEQSAKPPFAVSRARPLCPWPLVPRYKGGDSNNAARFQCQN